MAYKPDIVGRESKSLRSQQIMLFNSECAHLLKMMGQPMDLKYFKLHQEAYQGPVYHRQWQFSTGKLVLSELCVLLHFGLVQVSECFSRTDTRGVHCHNRFEKRPFENDHEQSLIVQEQVKLVPKMDLCKSLHNYSCHLLFQKKLRVQEDSQVAHQIFL